MPDAVDIPPRARAFTFVELMVVVALIALLLTIMAPALNRALELAREARCTANLKALARAVHLYGGNNGGYVPSRGGWHLALANGYLDSEHVEGNRIRKANSGSVLECPSDRDARDEKFVDDDGRGMSYYGNSFVLKTGGLWIHKTLSHFDDPATLLLLTEKQADLALIQGPGQCYLNAAGWGILDHLEARHGYKEDVKFTITYKGGFNNQETFTAEGEMDHTAMHVVFLDEHVELVHPGIVCYPDHPRDLWHTYLGWGRGTIMP